MTVADQLVELAKSPDPFRGAPTGLAELQLEAIRERFAERRQQIRTLDKRAREMGVNEIRSLNDVVPLLFVAGVFVDLA
jgi:sirohydrochlorin ferrochelatase